MLEFEITFKSFIDFTDKKHNYLDWTVKQYENEILEIKEKIKDFIYE